MHSRRQGRYALVISLCALAAMAGLTTIASFSALIPLRASSEGSAPVSEPREERMGTVILHRGEDGCKEMKFDNDSGRTVENFAPCDNKLVLDAHGIPVPQGTVHRLDAINRSFLGR
jgi:hypothetical protein